MHSKLTKYPDGYLASITPFGAVLTVFGVIGVIETLAYGVGYAHGWNDKQIEKMSN